ncbi:MAG: dsDNA nuclease domain-containing protein [Clostridia bacterium]
MDNDNYLKLMCDLAGSRSKNRFRAEILWGIKRMFEIYEKGDFYIIFDYVCDIEIHTKDELEFYQIKTHNSENYSLTDIIRKNKAGKSILGKLFEIKNKCTEIGEKSKIEIVSNVPLKTTDKKVYNTVEEKELIDLPQEQKEKIVINLKEELMTANIDLENSFYRYTTMNLLQPENDIIAEIVRFIEDRKNVTGIKIRPLYRLLYTKVSEKACYEFMGNTYEEILKNKGLTKKEFDKIISKYIKVTDNSVQKADEYINSEYKDNFQKQLDMKKALTTIVKNLLFDKELKEREKKILLYIEKNKKIMEQSIENIIEVIYNKFKENFSLIYSEDEIKAFIILILYKLMEEMYEENDNK